MILPDTQDACGRFRIRAVDVFEDRIFRRGDADETILVLLRTCRALFVLLALVECNDACAETQTHELMTAADCEYGSFRLVDKPGKVVEDRLLVVIEIAQRAAQNNRVRR